MGMMICYRGAFLLITKGGMMSFKDKLKLAIIDSSDIWYAQPRQIYNELVTMGYECLWLARPNHEGARSTSVPPGYITICIANNVSPIDLMTRQPLTLAHPPLERAYKSKADFVFVGDKTTFLTYFSHRPNTFYMPYAVNTDTYKPIMEVDEVYDVGFVGNIRNEERKRRLDLIRDHFHCFVGQKLFMNRANRMLNCCKIIFNTSDAKEINMRVFEALATGKLLVTDRVEYLDELFEDGIHLVTYSNERELIEKISYYLENDEKREEIARNGLDIVREYHTYRRRAEFIIEKIMQSDFLTQPDERKHLSNSCTYRKFYEKQSETNRLAQERLFDPTIPDPDSGGMYNVRGRLKEALKVARGKVLDIGCQRGGYCFHLNHVGLDVVGIDISMGYLKMAKDKVPDARFAQANAQFLPFKDRSFDTIILSEILEHVIDEKQVISEVKRVLKPGGVVFVTVPNYIDETEEHVRFLSKRRLADLFKNFSLSFQDNFHIRSTILVACNQRKTNVSAENVIRKEQEGHKKLSILLTNHHLLDFTGSEVFTFTVADFLKKNGHDVVVYSKYIDRIRKYFNARNIPIVDDLSQLKRRHFDVAHVHHNINALEVRHFFPGVPIVFLSHGVLPFLEQPPLVDIHISKFLAVSEEVQNNLTAKLGDNHAVDIYRNIVDTSIFHPYSQIRNEPRNALVLSNRIDPTTEQKIREACRLLNIRCKFIGLRFREIDYFHVPHYINRADIVFSLGRGAIEAMLCARIPIIFDYLGGDGLVTPSNFYDIMKCNFSGRARKINFSVESLVEEIQKYNSQYGQELQRIACSHYGAETQIHKLIDIYKHAIKDKIAPLTPENTAYMEYIISTVHESRSYMENYLGRRARPTSEEPLSEAIPVSPSSRNTNADRYENAENELLAQLSRNPDDPAILHQYAILLFQEGRLGEAIEEMNRALELDPLNAEFHNDIGAIHHASGDLAKAQGYFERALSINPQDRISLKNLIELFIEEEKLENAREMCRRLISLNADDEEAKYLWNLVDNRLKPQSEQNHDAARHAPSSISKPERILADRLQPRTQGKASPDRETANSIQKNKVQWSNYDWSQGGDEWSASWGGTEQLWHKTILPRIRRCLPSGHILEIAPGFGRCTQYLVRQCDKLTLVDLTEKCIQAYKQRFSNYPHVHYFVNDGKSLDMIEDNSVDFVFSWDSLVHVEKDVMQSYLHDLSSKLKPGGVGFLHHSNIGAFRDPKTGKLTVKNRHWRGENMSAELFRVYCQEAGLSCLTQEIIAWGDSILNDCFSTFIKKDGIKPDKIIILENPDFMEEAKGLKNLPDIYGCLLPSLESNILDTKELTANNTENISKDDSSHSRGEILPPSCLLSIILTVKGNMKEIYRSVQSILRNIPLQGVELILVDIGSSDDAREYIKQLRHEHTTAILLDGKVTPVQGSITGAGKASGEFLAFLDESVIITQSWFSCIMNVLKNASDWDAIVGKTISTGGMIVEAGSTVVNEAELVSRGGGIPFLDPAYNFTCPVVSGSRHCMIIRRKTWDEMNAFDPDLKSIGAALIDFGLKMVSRGCRILYQPQCILVANSISSPSAAVTDNHAPDYQTLASLRPRDFTSEIATTITKSSHKNILVLGIYLANTTNTVSDIVSVLSRSEKHTIVQKWVALNGQPPDEATARVTVKTLTGKRPKFQIINDLLAGDDLSRYDYVILCDDDVVLPEQFVDTFIAMQSSLGLAIAQPARTLNSYIDHPIVEQHLGVHARQTLFVEIGPVVSFHTSVFDFVFPFDLISPMGWGYENVWAHEIIQRGLKMGIIDAVCVDHSLRKPVANYNWEDADRQRSAYLKKHDHLSLDECFKVINTYIIAEEST
jgi:ubiquinone/menaquinone biosynthesis C-methylase UbiE